jgi:hypothetical protein
MARTIGSPRSVAHLQAGAPVGQPEAAQPQVLPKLKHVLPAGLRAIGVIREQRRVDPELARDEGEHRRGGCLRRGQTPAWVAKGTELDGEPQAVAGAALRADERQVRGAQHVVPGHLGGIDRDGEQAQALLAGEQGAAGHGGLASICWWAAFHIALAFGRHSETGY